LKIAQVVFWGATGQAKVLRELLSEGPALVALFENDRTLSSPWSDVPIHYGRDGFSAWVAGQTGPAHIGCLVAIGGDRGRDRVELQRQMQAHGLVPIVAQHRTAFVSPSAHVGAGSQILAHAVVSVEASLGEACIVNTAATVDHECRLGHGVHVCPGAHLAGLVEVGDNVMIGTGASVLPRIRIGAGAIIAAGAVVVRDVRPGDRVAGVPARSIAAVR
jgi:sugar O-acyltransferase (sialic acid O-acetyltransferase NeuD family)